MPRFSDVEKSKIHTQLRHEGAKRFIVHGIRKVTIDELTNAVGISKGSFYAFYSSKEHLYIDILMSWQQKMLAELDKELHVNPGMLPKDIAKAVAGQMMQGVLDSPFLLKTDAQTLEMLRRKLPHEMVDVYAHDGLGAYKLLHSFGLTFVYQQDVAVKALQAVFNSISQLEHDDVNTRTTVCKILLHGVMDQIIAS